MLICEEALKGHEGHWYEYNKAVVEMNRGAGNDVQVLAHTEVVPEIVREINAAPFFHYTNWDGIYHHSRPWRRYLGVARHNLRVYRAMAEFFRSHEPFDLVFAPTVVIHHLIAWLFLVRRFGGERFQRAVLLIRNSATTYYDSDPSAEPTFSRTAKILGAVLKRYRRHIDEGTVRLATDSHRLASEYKKLAGVDLVVFPHPRSEELHAPQANGTPRRSTGRPVTFTSLGPARWEKGIHILLEAIYQLAAVSDVPKMHFVIQWNLDVETPEGGTLQFDPSKIEGTPVSCEILTEGLSSAEYNKRLGDSDCLVLPYLRQAYFARISGVAVEAMIKGIPIIYTDDTWVADVAVRFGHGFGFPNEDAAALKECLLTAAQSVTEAADRAAELAPAARKHFSATNFMDLLWEP